MHFRSVLGRGVALAAFAVVVVCSSRSWAQTVVNPQAGVVVDAEGVLRVQTFADPTGELSRDRLEAAKAAIGPDLRQFSRMRKISLNRLEAAIRDRQGAVSDDMRNLAGLLRVRYVFYYPESKDIVIAGPAEGWMTDGSGRVVGLTSRRPVVQLQDLAVALRAFPPDGKPTDLIGCSIDPTKDGLAAMQQFLRSIGSHAEQADTARIVQGLQTSLGLQTVSINGVSPRTHMAQVLVEADYRMKLIGIGLERPPVHLASYVDRANPASVSRNALERWYFVPDYQCVRVSEDGAAMELVGDGVKLVGEGEQVSHTGERSISGRTNRASQAWTNDFTKQYAELAERSPVFAQLRNMIDLVVAAAFLQKHDYYGQADWRADLLRDEKQFAVEVYNSPKQVGTAVKAIWRGNRLMTPVGGGVVVQATEALQADNLLPDDKGQVAKLRSETKIELPAGQWWWD